MEISRQQSTFSTAVFTSVCLAVAASASAAEPSPTPQPGTLAAYASSTTLDRSSVGDGTGPVVITTDDLARLGAGAAVSEITAPQAELPPVDIDPGVDPEIRARWRNKVLAQGQSLARLEARRQGVLDEIDRLERGRLDSRTLDRIAKAESKLAQVEAQIRREKAHLSRLVREARKEGAQPGWFR